MWVVAPPKPAPHSAYPYLPSLLRHWGLLSLAEKSYRGLCPHRLANFTIFFKVMHFLAYFNSNYCPNHVYEIPRLLFATLAKKQPVT